MQQGTPIQHDTTNYGTGLTTGRGNLTRTKRWDVINTSQSTETKVGYNTTGAAIFTRSPIQTSDTQVNIIYTDSFSDWQNRNTYAYPTETTIKDTVGTTPSVTISNKTQYSFDTGAVTRTEGPPPAGQSQGAIFTNAYDSADRLYQTTNTFNGAYTYIVYPTSSNVVQTYVTITSTSTPTVSSKLFDGAGRVRATAAEHPGSTGGYVGQITVYDLMGRAIQTSNPTEIYGSWQPAGDDAASGWIYGYQTYDWKGRPRITTNQDGTTREATYGGCGCAGGEVVTVRDEIGRRQRLTSDVLARPLKKEVLGWDGTTVYSTVANTYNASDQITRVLEQAGTVGTSQETLMTYDGYGRLLTSHRPEQASGAVTSYLYYADDSPQSVTDGRGAMTAYGYNNRRLVTQVSYSATSGSDVIVPTTTLFAYDSAGNRTFMDDEWGSVTYEVDPLSRITTETRQFDASLPQAPLSNNRFRLSYTYNLVGLFTGLTDPYGQQFYYTRDNLGRLTSVTGSSFGGVTQYASNAQYRASGALKRLEYGNGQIMKITAVNNRLQALNFEISKTGSDVVKKQYQYYADGQLRYSQDQLNAKFDRLYNFDFAGRMVEAKSGAEARGQTEEDGNNRPYRESYGYDAFNHLNSRTSLNWTQQFSSGSVSIWTNNRHEYWSYDADGNLLCNGEVYSVYDAATRPAVVTAYEVDQTANSFDGDGQVIKQIKSTYNEQTQTYTPDPARYFIRSLVLQGQVVSETHPEGQKLRTLIPADGSILAWQYKSYNPPYPDEVKWEHREPSGASFRSTSQSGGINYGAGEESPVELDPMNADVQLSNPYLQLQPEPGTSYSLYPSYGTPGYQSTSYSVDGMPVSADRFMQEVTTWFGSGLGFGLLDSNVRVSQHLLGWWQRITYFHEGNYTQILGVSLRAVFDSSWAFSTTILLQSSTPQNPFPGFDKGKLGDIDSAIRRGAKLLSNKDCQKGLSAAGIGFSDVNRIFGNLKARPASVATTSGFNIFYAEISTDPFIQRFLQTEKGKGAGGFIHGQDVMLRDSFFNARGGAKINAEVSRALALIHEVIHLTGKTDSFFGGSAKLNDVVIRACYSKLYGHNDLAIVGN